MGVRVGPRRPPASETGGALTVQFADLHFIAEPQMPRHSDSFLPSPRRQLSPKDTEGQVQGGTDHVQAEA